MFINSLSCIRSAWLVIRQLCEKCGNLLLQVAYTYFSDTGKPKRRVMFLAVYVFFYYLKDNSRIRNLSCVVGAFINMYETDTKIPRLHATARPTDFNE